MSLFSVFSLMLGSFLIGNLSNFHRPKKESPAEREKEVAPPSRSAISIMKNFLQHRILFNHFHVTESAKGETHFQYKENEWTFRLAFSKGNRLQFWVDRSGENMLTYEYVYASHTNKPYEKEKTIKRKLFDTHNPREAMKSLDEFLTLLVQNPSFWGFLNDRTCIIDDVTPEEQAEGDMLEENKTVGEAVGSLSALVKRDYHNLPAEIADCYIQILQNMQACLPHIHEMDEETRHSLEYLMRHDIDALFQSYRKLNDANRDDMAEEVWVALRVILAKTDQIKVLLEEKNKQEVAKHVRLIQVREY